MRKFKNFRYLGGINDDFLMLALLMAKSSSKNGRILLAAFPKALTTTLDPISPFLVERVEEFGLHHLVNALNAQGYQATFFCYREPQNDFDGDAPPDGVTIADLKRGKYLVRGKSWSVIGTRREFPYPSTRPERIEYYFFCIPSKLYTKV